MHLEAGRASNRRRACLAATPLRELGIGSILARSPQAKGRVERSFHTAQDRLVKQLRLAKVNSLSGANAFLENEYWPESNQQFARPVQDFANHHRPLSEAQESLLRFGKGVRHVAPGARDLGRHRRLGRARRRKRGMAALAARRHRRQWTRRMITVASGALRRLPPRH